MRYWSLSLGLAASLIVASSSVLAGGDQNDVNSYDNMGYYVFSSDDPYQVQQNNFNSMSVGIQVGMNPNSYDFTSTGTNPNRAKLSNMNAIGGLLYGWGFTWSEFFMGLETNFRYTMGGANGVTESTGVAGNKLKPSWSAGLGFKIGGIVYNTALIYFYAGGAYSGFKFSDNNYLSNSATKSRFGYSVGPGIEVQMNTVFNLDLRYLYRGYGKMSVTTGATTNTYKPSENLFLLAGVFHF